MHRLIYLYNTIYKISCIYWPNILFYLYTLQSCTHMYVIAFKWAEFLRTSSLGAGSGYTTPFLCEVVDSLLIDEDTKKTKKLIDLFKYRNNILLYNNVVLILFKTNMKTRWNENKPFSYTFPISMLSQVYFHIQFMGWHCLLADVVLAKRLTLIISGLIVSILKSTVCKRNYFRSVF